jgi:hypothetical protein
MPRADIGPIYSITSSALASNVKRCDPIKEAP